MSDQGPYEPRAMLPYTDQEIRELYRAAGGSDRASREDAAKSWWAVADVALICLFTSSLCLGLVANLWSLSAGIWASIVGFLVPCLLLAPRFGVKLVGPFSRKAFARSTHRDIDPYDVAVLQRIVDHLASQPLDEARRLRESIQASQQRIDASLADLGNLGTELKLELLATEDSAMQLMVQARLDAVYGVTKRLCDLEAELLAQLEDSERAVQPIRELKNRFSTLERIGNSLARIQAAHGLADEAGENLGDYRLQLRVLGAATASAMAKLGDIQRTVDAKEAAEKEVQALSEG